MTQLTLKKIKELKALGPSKTSDGRGLSFVIPKRGEPYWSLRYSFYGKRRELTLGKDSELSLAEARTQAENLRGVVRKGVDPLYAQVLEEWQSQLKQMELLKGQIDEGNWSTLVGPLELGFPLDPSDPYWENWAGEKLDESGFVDIKKRIEKFHEMNRKLSETTADILDIYEDADATAAASALDQAERKAAWEEEQAIYTVYLNKGMKAKVSNLDQAISDATSIREWSMGEETQLKTLEAIAYQNEVTILLLKAKLDFEVHKSQTMAPALYKEERHANKIYDLRIQRMKEMKNSPAYSADTSENAYKTTNF